MTVQQSKRFFLDSFIRAVERFEIKLVSTPVVARVKKLRVRWTAEEDQELHTDVEYADEETRLQLEQEIARAFPDL